MVDMSRRVDPVDSRLFSVPPVSAFRSYQEHRRQFSGDSAENRTDNDDDDDDGRDDVGHTDDGGDGRRGRDAVEEDHGAALSQPRTPSKNDYSVAKLLRDDRSSSSSVAKYHAVGPSDRGRHDDPAAAESLFRGWTGIPVDRPPLPPSPFAALATAHHHRWAEWTVSDSWRRPELANPTQRRCLNLFPTQSPSVNFTPNCTSRHLRRGTELQLPAFSQQHPMHRRPGKYTRILRSHCTLLYSRFSVHNTVYVVTYALSIPPDSTRQNCFASIINRAENSRWFMAICLICCKNSDAIFINQLTNDYPAIE